ncbi:hypothetical protein LRP_1905 [Ligilactobacillus ruminis]|nr:hypothetical protein LRP_1905 [Ligilactobacillus ruminis]
MIQSSLVVDQAKNIAGFFRVFVKCVDDLENFTSEMEWSLFVPIGLSCVL